MEITVVGGGTAGWISALFLAHKSNAKVKIVASSKIGILGAGEGVTGELMDFILGYYGDFGIDPIDFIKKTAAMPKYGILHKNWVKDYNYFAPIDGTPTALNLPDSVTAFLTVNDKQNLHRGTYFGCLMEARTAPILKRTGTYEEQTHAWHFDARLVADYLEKVCIRYENVELIDAIINDVTLDEKGRIDKLVLDNDDIVDSDFYIDCSGFKRILANKLGTKWICYKENLPVDRAIPFFLQYDDTVKPDPYTEAHALSAGWMWQASIQTRKGCGYTYCSDFISDDEALNEIEKTLGRKIEPLRDPFTFDTGRLENTWVKNCLTIGLSSTFAEPLEATSIHGAIVQLKYFAFEYLKDDIETMLNPACIKAYNKRVNQMFDDFKDFLVAHYMGGRTDSEFWRYVTSGAIETEFSKMIREMCKTKMPTLYDFPSYPGAAGWQLWSYILIQTGQLSPEVCSKYLYDFSIDQAQQELSALHDRIERIYNANYQFNDFTQTINQENIKWEYTGQLD